MLFIPFFLLTFNEQIHLGPNQSFRDLANAWKDDLAYRVSGKWLQILRPNILTLLSPNAK